MKLDLVNIIAISTVIIGLTYLVWELVLFLKQIKRLKKTEQSESEKDDAYQRIVNSTYEVENERQINHGDHLDEQVYLNRAKNIRLHTDFFKDLKS